MTDFVGKQTFDMLAACIRRFDMVAVGSQAVDNLAGKVIKVALNWYFD